MLRKLIKYDWKALSRTLLLLHVFILIFALIGRIFIMNNISAREPNVPEMIYMMLFFFLLTAIYSATSFIFGVYFYKNLFSTQGYLTWTLPATTNQQLLSKVIVAFLWSILDFLLLTLAVVLFFAPLTDVVGITSTFFQFFGSSAFPLIFTTALFFILATLSSILTIYLSAAIGQSFANHRIIASIVTYGIFSIILQIVTIVFFVVTAENTATISGIDLYFRVALISNVFLFVQVALFYGITHHLMKRKLNLT